MLATRRGRAGLLGAVLLVLCFLAFTVGAVARPQMGTVAAKHHHGKSHKRSKHHKRKHKRKHHAGPQWLVLNNPINPMQEEDLPFGTRSQWLQPWRAYLDTPPASDLADGLGINFNVTAKQAEVTAAALENAGFHVARIEIPWDSISATNPNQLGPNAAALAQAALSALVSHHIRPLILLNANDEEPTPNAPVTLHIVAPAPAGSRAVVLDLASAAQVAVGRTGFNTLNPNPGGAAAHLLITSLKGTVATLSAPLQSAVSPGDYPGFTLAYAPFTDPSTSLPALNASFNTTLQGWLAYVNTVGNFVRSVVGSGNFDMEIWNELSFGSDFLNINDYYSPPVDPLAPSGAGSEDSTTIKAILDATAADIQQLFPGVAIGDGFSDQEPYTSGATVPPYVNIDKHYYEGTLTYPAANAYTGIQPKDWFGRPFGTYSPATGTWTDFWVPSYTADFPEYWLTGLDPQNLVRDLTPLTEDIGGQPHGRYTHPPGAPPPQVWMTETNDPYPTTMTPDQAQRFQAKVVMRYLLSYINKGLGRVYFYAVTGGNLGLLTPAFTAAAASGQATDPGVALDALGRMINFIHTDPSMQPRSVNLLQIATTDQRVVFNGSGYIPALRNLDVTAFLPFQEATNRFLFAAYVMTRNLGQPWQAPGPDEFDMPAAPYRFEIGNVKGCDMKFTGYDPLNNTNVKVTVIRCSQHRVTFQAPLTDSPILIQATEVAPHPKKHRHHPKHHTKHHPKGRHPRK